MTEPENFDDDLFADLYDDNDASAPPASAPAPVVAQPVAEASAPTFNNEPEPSSAAYQHDQNEYGDEQAGEYEDDDDEVDFNLGNGPSNTAASAAPPQAMHLEVSTPNFQLHKPSNANSKEDGIAVIVRDLHSDDVSIQDKLNPWLL